MDGEYTTNTNQKKVGVAVLTSEETSKPGKVTMIIKKDIT